MSIFPKFNYYQNLQTWHEITLYLQRTWHLQNKLLTFFLNPAQGTHGSGKRENLAPYIMLHYYE